MDCIGVFVLCSIIPAGDGESGIRGDEWETRGDIRGDGRRWGGGGRRTSSRRAGGGARGEAVARNYCAGIPPSAGRSSRGHPAVNIHYC